MYIQPISLLSRLLGAAWTILFIATLLWLAVHLLAEVWVWVVGIFVPILGAGDSLAMSRYFLGACSSNTTLVPQAGIEPATYRLEGECSIR